MTTTPPPLPTSTPAGQPQPQDAPEVDTRQVIRWITTPTSQLQAQPKPAEPTIRPLFRAAAPILTVLDDGSLETGEDHRIRTDRLVIGRTEGDILIPTDNAISFRHAEIRRTQNDGQAVWYLHDLDTSNGTFVRVNGGKIGSDTLLTLGMRRFRLKRPFAEVTQQQDDGTRELDLLSSSADIWPTLVESREGDSGLAFPLQKAKVTIGSLGGGCDIEIDDPHLASHHATLLQTGPGSWRIKAEESVNGTLVSLKKVRLTEHCFFRCGEQLFRFVIP